MSYGVIKKAAITLAAFALFVTPAHAFDSPVERVTVDPHYLGATPPEPQPRLTSAEVREARAAGVGLPVSVDLTPYAMTPRNQGQVGSCAAWATIYAAMGYWINKQGIAGGALAPMYTYAQISRGVDGGSSPQSNLQGAFAQGADTRAHYGPGDFNYTTQPTAAERANAGHWRVSGYDWMMDVRAGQATNQDLIKAELAGGRPVVVSLPVYTDFDAVRTANRGFYTHTGGTYRGSHAVAALGYDATGLRIQNSWGTGWGDGGFATLSWEFVNTYVNQAVAVSALEDDVAPAGTPVIEGTIARGETLTAGAEWSPRPDTITYQWQRDGVDIAGATTDTYTLASADVGHRVRVVETATTAYGATTSASAASALVIEPPTPATAPTITGEAVQGHTLQASTGAFNPPNPAYGYSYAWLRCSGGWCGAIPGATSASYTLTATDVGYEIAVKVTATAPGGAAATGQSQRTSAALGPPLVATRAPTVVGVAGVGETLTADEGAWSVPLTRRYLRWERCSGSVCTEIPTNGDTTYMVQYDDFGKTVRLRVIAVSPGRTESAVSAQTAVVTAPAPSPLNALAIVGTAQRGKTLNSGGMQWSGFPTNYSSQWLRCDARGAGCMPVPGWGGYELTAADVGRTIRYRLEATNYAGTGTALSAPTAVVIDTPAAPAAPVTPVPPVSTPTVTPRPPVYTPVPVTTPTPAPQVAKTLATGTTSLRTSDGAVVAKATVAVKNGTATVTLKAGKAGYRAKACSKNRCSATVKLGGAKPVTLKVKLAKNERVRVVISK